MYTTNAPFLPSFWTSHRTVLAMMLLGALAILSVRADAQIDDEPAATSAEETSAPSHAAKKKPKSQQQLQSELLARTQPPSTVQWLNVGSSKFLGLYHPAEKPRAHGAVLMLHSAGEHPDWPGAFADLRTYLPTVGWATLAIALPDPALPPPPTAKPKKPESTNDEDLGDSTDPSVTVDDPARRESEDIFDAEANEVTDGVEVLSQNKPEAPITPSMAEEQSVDRIIAAFEFLNEKGDKPFVILAQGWGAARAGQYLQEIGGQANIRALVFINAENNLPNGSFDLVAALNGPNLPLLDLVEMANARLHTQAEARRKKMNAIGATGYRLVGTAPPSVDNENLLKNVYGFLKSEIAR